MSFEKKEKILSVRIHPELLHALTKAAEDNNVTPSWLARKAIRNYLAQHYPEQLNSEPKNEEPNRDA